MAGLTHDTNKIRLPVDGVEERLSIPDGTGHVSIFGIPDNSQDVCDDMNGVCRDDQVNRAIFSGQAQFLKHDRRHIVATNSISDSGEGLDATFRVTSPYSRSVTLPCS